MSEGSWFQTLASEEADGPFGAFQIQDPDCDPDLVIHEREQIDRWMQSDTTAADLGVAVQ